MNAFSNGDETSSDEPSRYGAERTSTKQHELQPDGPDSPLDQPHPDDGHQEILDANRQGHREHWRKSDALLIGKLFDDRGNRMTPSYAIKRGIRYRYYVSAALLQGNKADVGSVGRVAAQDIEDRVVSALASRSLLENGCLDQREALRATVDKITVGPAEIIILQKASGASGAPHAIRLSWTPPKQRRCRSMTAPAGGSGLSAPRVDR